MSSDTTKNTSGEKREVLNRFLKDQYVLIHISPEVEGVSVPTHLGKGPTVTFKLSSHFRGQMEISEGGVVADLLFGDRYFTCRFPFECVWGMTGERGQFLMWPESTPSEVLESIERQASENIAQELAGKDKKRSSKAKLSPVAAAAKQVTDEEDPEGPPPVKPPSKGSRPVLRRVK